MTVKDRDNFFSLMVFYDKITEWRENNESEITSKDRTKLKIIADTIIALLVQYRKREGETALNAILDESDNYKFVIMKKDEDLELTGTFELDIVKNAMKEIAKTSSECVFCEKKQHNKCPWYTLHKFMGTEEVNTDKNKCPYKFNDNEIFDIGDIDNG